MSIILTLIIGLIAGYIAEKATKSEMGLIGNLIVGLIGAFLGGRIAAWADIEIGDGFIAELIVATLGAVLFLVVWQAIRGRR
jgi:uncharacterized membrane protein YeaQ/YmgE (transglycosylase-associated protein family)